MNKILIIFRGINLRIRGNSGILYKISAIDGINNWKKTIFDDLKNNNIEYDVAFVTYPSEILNELTDEIKPKYVITEGYDNQIENMNVVKDFMLKLEKEYDRFVICRFDYQYKFKITNWPSWNKSGIIITNPDHSGNLFSDILFIVDSNSTKEWSNAVNSITSWPHQIGSYLTQNNIPFSLMYNDAHGALEHPLYSYITIEETPNIE